MTEKKIVYLLTGGHNSFVKPYKMDWRVVNPYLCGARDFSTSLPCIFEFTRYSLPIFSWDHSNTLSILGVSTPTISAIPLMTTKPYSHITSYNGAVVRLLHRMFEPFLRSIGLYCSVEIGLIWDIFLDSNACTNNKCQQPVRRYSVSSSAHDILFE